jgi:uncharacterized protein YwgA
MAIYQNRRFKDVLIALAVTTRRDLSLHRIQLQKLIYLQEVFSSVWREISMPAGFQPDNHGPYDKHIQNAVDALAFRGLVEVTSIEFERVRKTKATYRLTREGLKAVDLLNMNNILKEELLLAEEIANEVGRRGWNDIVKIVYSEPTYVVAKDGANGQVLKTNDPSANITYQIVKAFSGVSSNALSEPMSIKCFIQIAFLVFDRFRLKQPRLV